MSEHEQGIQHSLSEIDNIILTVQCVYLVLIYCSDYEQWFIKIGHTSDGIYERTQNLARQFRIDMGKYFRDDAKTVWIPRIIPLMLMTCDNVRHAERDFKKIMSKYKLVADVEKINTEGSHYTELSTSYTKMYDLFKEFCEDNKYEIIFESEKCELSNDNNVSYDGAQFI
jgi:hypothetical protein